MGPLASSNLILPYVHGDIRGCRDEEGEPRSDLTIVDTRKTPVQLVRDFERVFDLGSQK